MSGSTTSRRLTIAAVAAGVALGACWTLSPMTVVFAIALVPLLEWGARGLRERERRWFYVLMATAIGVRLVVIAGLFLTADPNVASFATFFGDEEYMELRALRLHNIWLNVPISLESFQYAYGVTGWSSFINVIAYLQLLIGPAPYGVRLFDLLLFLVAATWLFRVVRTAYGTAAAFGGLALLLWIPSLFMWSISALKEPLYLLLATSAILLVVAACRRRAWAVRIGMLAVVAVGVASIETVRPGGAMLVCGGLIAGIAIRFLLWNARIAVVSLIIVPVAVVVALSQPQIERRVMDQIKWGANWHRGHVFTKGHSFKLLDETFYLERFYDRNLTTMTHEEAARFLVRAAVAFVAVPLPWTIVSRSELAFMPEQVLLYAGLLVLPFGIACAWRRDALLTAVLCGYSILSAGTIAVTSGNVGTLVRHRALVVPFIVWFVALGVVELLGALARSRTQSRAWWSERSTSTI